MTEKETLIIAALASAVGALLMVVLAVRAFLAKRAMRVEDPPDDTVDQMGQPVRFAFLARLVRPQTNDELSDLRQMLAQAGMRNQEAVDLYGVARVMSFLFGLALFALVGWATAFDPFSLIFGSMSMGLGYYGPVLWLRGRTAARQEAISEQLPPTLDLLVTCMEAGLGLEQALTRVANEIGFSDPEMADELSVVVAELKAGLSVGEAFRKLAERVTADEVRNLSGVIIQSASLGASLGRTLREYAASARRRRMLALEELAGKVTARLTLPLTMCLLPSAVIAMLGPAVVIVFNTLFE
ncbi:MAG: type II secretion system F family protein [Bradymonadia bacterium]